LACFQVVSGERRSLGDDLVRRAPNGGAAHVGRAAAAVAATIRDQVGVALPKMDALAGHPEPGREDLWGRRLVALADVGRAGDQGDVAVGLEADVDVLLRCAAGALDVICEAEPAP